MFFQWVHNVQGGLLLHSVGVPEHGREDVGCLRCWVRAKDAAGIPTAPQLLLITFVSLTLTSFGVCCLFLTEECGATVVQNNTYVRNPGFPDEYDEETDCSYNVRKMSPGELAVLCTDLLNIVATLP